jgi:hypothetical protein
MRRFRSALPVVVVLVAPSGAFAVTWPGAAPCNTTLAACVTGVASGSVVEIATQGPIDEDVNVLAKSLTLRAAPGFLPAFAPGRTLFANAASGSITVTFEGLTVTDGDVTLVRTGTGDATFAVRRMRVLATDPDVCSSIRIRGNNTGSLTFDIAENEVNTRCAFITDPAIEVGAQGPAASGRIRFNRVTSFGDSAAAGIGAFATDGTLELDVFANEVRGNFGIGAIAVNNAPGGVPAPIDVRIVNNVVVGYGANVGADSRNGLRVSIGADADVAAEVVNNTVVGTRGGLLIGRTVIGTTGTVTGAARNNLLAFNGSGFYIVPGTSTMTNAYNLVFGNGGNLFTPGVGTLFADPRLLSNFHPRLGAGSPAIDAGDSFYIQFLLALLGLPRVDADGMRRTIGSGSDIGAYEFGDASFLAAKTSTTGNNFAFDHPATNGQPNVRPTLTKNFSFAGVSDPFAIGAYYFGGLWRAFNQDVSDTMPAGTAMNVFVPGLGGPSGASYAHVATAANTSGHVTTLDNTYLNGTCNAIMLATNYWNASGSGVYNDHHISVGCLGSWFILNQDFVDMPLDAGFNVYAQDPSPNAYVHTVASHNVTLVNSTMLDHPLLNGVDCAQVQVTQYAGGALNDHPYDVYYMDGRWQIYNQDLAPLPMGAAFHVLVNPRQVFLCTDVIFADGFE